MTTLLVIPYNHRLFEALNISIPQNVIVRVALRAEISFHTIESISNFVDVPEMAKSRRSSLHSTDIKFNVV